MPDQNFDKVASERVVVLLKKTTAQAFHHEFRDIF